MKILFVYSQEYGLLPNGLLDHQERMQFGISYISSVLRQYGHQTELIVLSRILRRKNSAIAEDCLKRFKPGLICMTAVATQYPFLREIAKRIRRLYPEIYLVMGGTHATLYPDEILKDDFDAICIGEGEMAILELAAQLEKGQVPSGISNLWIKRGSAIERNAPEEFFRDLDALPFPDREMWQKWMFQKTPERCSLLLSRGCPFDCTYCSNPALKKSAPGLYVRYRSPDNIVAEIKGIREAFPSMREIYFETESIGMNLPWCRDLCLALERLNASLETPLTYGANIRIVSGVGQENIFPALQRANFRFVNIGLESGSDRIRREILGRSYSNDDIVNAVRIARRHNLKISLFNLIGVPGETLSDFRETVKINRICKPDWHFTSIFFPYPGTDLYRVCGEKGLLNKPLDPVDERRRAVLDLPGFSKKQIQECYDFFDWYIYKGFDPEDGFRIRLLKMKEAALKLLRQLKEYPRFLISRARAIAFK